MDFPVVEGVEEADSEEIRAEMLLIYRSWLREKYDSIKELNRAYSAVYGSFGEVVPPPKYVGPAAHFVLPHPVGDAATLRRYYDFLEFGAWYVQQYIVQIRDIYKEQGVDIPIVTNLVTWYWPQR